MNKKLTYTIIAILLCCVWLLSPLTPVSLYKNMTAQAVSALWDGSVAAGFAGGTGTEADPFLISTAEQLAYFSQRVNSGITYAGKYIQLTQDILLNEMTSGGTFVSATPRAFTNIGSGSGKSFQGHFDGDGKEVIGLYINNASWTRYGGLFSYAAAGSVIQNVSISGVVNGGYYTGGVAGYTNGLITGCAISCTVTGGETHAGGVAGAAGANSEISNCAVSGTVHGRSYVGGVAGQTEGVITGCIVSCTVTGVDFYIGGIAGYANTGSEVSNSSASGTVSGRSYIGGVAGYTDGVITVCANRCAVTGLEENIGGVAGYADSHNTVSNCFNSGAITASGNGNRSGIGGIVGGGNWTNTASTIHNNLSIGAVTGRINVGGIVGSSAAPLGIQDAWNNYYINAPAGTGNGDVWTQDGAVPIGDMSWVEIVELLNSNNPAGNDTWSEDENGIPLPGIFVPGNAVEILNSNIKEGKYFTAELLGEGTSATITSDSVFTVVFSINYNESCSLETQALGLADNGAAVQLPAGTSIIMRAEDGYYYVNLASSASTIALGEFIKMGSTTDYYAPSTQAQPNDVKDFLFIFDFTKTSSQIAAGTYQVELLTAAGESADTMPAVTVAGINTYSLTVSGTTGSLTINLSSAPVAGYDHKTYEKSCAYELHMEQSGATAPFPIGTKINGTVISSALPYAITTAAFGDTSVSIDMSGCAEPLAPGNYDIQIKAYACTDVTTPRDGYLLASGSATITLATPAQYAIKASAATRVFDKSASAIPVVFDIETLGSGTVKSTLQRKYGTAYVNITDQTDLPASISGGSAALTIPAGYENGTYRFVLTLYDNNDTARAQAVESVIIK